MTKCKCNIDVQTPMGTNKHSYFHIGRQKNTTHTPTHTHTHAQPHAHEKKERERERERETTLSYHPLWTLPWVSYTSELTNTSSSFIQPRTSWFHISCLSVEHREQHPPLTQRHASICAPCDLSNSTL